MKHYKYFIVITSLLSVISMFCEQSEFSAQALKTAGQVIDYVLMLCVLGETATSIVTAKFKLHYIKENWASLTFTAIFTFLFCYSKFMYKSLETTSIAVLAVIIRNIFVGLRIYSRMKRLQGYVEKMITNPAQTILLSFIAVIMTGSLLLMMNFATVDGRGLSFLKSLFTATSCVCVTGLTVVDTATTFTFFGQLVLLLLIQIGGLGIMLLSYFTIYIIKRRVSLEDKMMLGYMLSEDSTAGIYSSMKNIVLTTFCIEAIGAVALFLGFTYTQGLSLKTLWFAVFHSISAFCNAGFALFSDSLESFRSNPYMILTISSLIILGGIGFSVITNIRAVMDSSISKKNSKQQNIIKQKLSLNTKIVLLGTLIMLVSGTLIFYILEFNNSMKEFNIAEQYIAAFFQSVTFRTAGFNSVSFGTLRPATYLVFCVFMLVGAASGSTAGGMKINTLAVLFAALHSYWRGEKHYKLGNHEIAQDKVLQACIIFIADIVIVITAASLITITDTKPVEKVLFEVCSALGTAGVTANLTPELSVFAKTILIILMFWGRVGALTILSAGQSDSSRTKIRWPQADISIG